MNAGWRKRLAVTRKSSGGKALGWGTVKSSSLGVEATSLGEFLGWEFTLGATISRGERGKKGKRGCNSEGEVTPIAGARIFKCREPRRSLNA